MNVFTRFVLYENNSTQEIEMFLNNFYRTLYGRLIGVGETTLEV